MKRHNFWSRIILLKRPEAIVLVVRGLEELIEYERDLQVRIPFTDDGEVSNDVEEILVSIKRQILNAAPANFFKYEVGTGWVHNKNFDWTKTNWGELPS